MENHLQQLRRLGNYQTVYVDETSCSAISVQGIWRGKKREVVKGCIKGKKYQRSSLIAAKIRQKLIATMIDKETMVSYFFAEWFKLFYHLS